MSLHPTEAAVHDESFNEPTLGEIYRVLLEVRTETRRTNGRVTALEQALAVHRERIDRIAQPLTITTPTSVPIAPLPLDWKKFISGIAIIGGSVWIACELLFRFGEWLHKQGMR